MLVTIMIPTYNQKDYIIESIQSALCQSYNNIEVIVNDDYSTDATFKIASTIKDDRLKVFKNEQNLGRVKNYRKLLYDLAHGEFVINLDGDDYFTDNDYIKKAVRLVQKNSLDLIFSNQILQYPTFKKETIMNLPEVIDGNWLFLNYGKNGIGIPHMTALYNRKKALKLNFYSKDIISSDWESLLRFIINSRIGFINDASSVWRQVESSQSKSQDIQKVLKNFELTDNVLDFAKNYFNEHEIRVWDDRIKGNMIKDINIYNVSCNFFKILNFSYKSLSKLEFFKLLINYRFIGKVLLGKCKYSCVQ